MPYIPGPQVIEIILQTTLMGRPTVVPTMRRWYFTRERGRGGHPADDDQSRSSVEQANASAYRDNDRS